MQVKKKESFRKRNNKKGINKKFLKILPSLKLISLLMIIVMGKIMILI